MQCRAQTPKTKGKGEFCAVSFADSSAIPKRPVRGGTLSWEIGESPVEHARSRVQTFFFNEKKNKKKTKWRRFVWVVRFIFHSSQRASVTLLAFLFCWFFRSTVAAAVGALDKRKR